MRKRSIDCADCAPFVTQCALALRIIRCCAVVPRRCFAADVPVAVAVDLPLLPTVPPALLRHWCVVPPLFVGALFVVVVMNVARWCVTLWRCR
ncbi:hypothetical protein AVEN_64034-1 [Araneus ventricosus]|uniref:Uncharacterized protein n=1 Tax=Araneus ventricosus TaxID=182803 RepID=A0A4Y2WKC0_ARAVE|nr:hypothetical protein AVEN_64034-1 [Araneus ventricosus]